MIIYPAIDLKDGQCVRLYKGEMDKATVFNDDPASQARAFEDAGAEWLHVVDLNGAFEGKSVNRAPVEQILKQVRMPVQLGGGIRTMAQIDQWIALGLSRVILGTVAVRDPELVKAACQRHPGKIAVGIDARGGYVAVEGWAETSEMTVIELAKQFEGAGVSAIIYTDINRDGTLTGPDVDGTQALAQAVSIPVIASGGMQGIEDVDALKAAGGIAGVIIGRALYDKRIMLEAAVARAKVAA